MPRRAATWSVDGWDTRGRSWPPARGAQEAATDCRLRPRRVTGTSTSRRRAREHELTTRCSNRTDRSTLRGLSRSSRVGDQWRRSFAGRQRRRARQGSCRSGRGVGWASGDPRRSAVVDRIERNLPGSRGGDILVPGRAHQFGELTTNRHVDNDGDPPGLPIAAGRSETSIVEDLGDDVVGHQTFEELPDRTGCPYCLAQIQDAYASPAATF